MKETDRSQEGAGSFPGNKQEPKNEARGGAIQRLFRQLKAALTDNAPARAPEPKKKRRDEDTHGLFKIARRLLCNARNAFKQAKEVFHRERAPEAKPPPPVALPRNHPANYDWTMRPDYDEHAEHLRFLEMSEQEDFNPQHDNGGFHYAESGHLSPRL